MKKNKRLLYTLGNIPEKYIDESMTEQARRTKIQWKYIVTAAACFTAIAAVPVYMIRKSINEHGDDIGTVTQISQITSDNNTDTTQTEQNTDQTTEVTNSCAFPGTGPEKPADYTPDRKISSISFSHHDDIDDFKIEFLKDKEFQERINSDIRKASDSLIQRYDYKNLSKFNFNEGAEYWEMGKQSGQECIMQCQNGYLSVIIGYTTMLRNNLNDNGEVGISYDYIEVLNYDLIEQKKIENLTDLFYNGEDVLSLINHTIKDKIDIETDSMGKLFLKQTMKKEFDGFTQIPELFTISDIIFNTDNPFFSVAPLIEYRSDGYDDIIDHMIIGKYRDMTDIVGGNDKYAHIEEDLENCLEWNGHLNKEHDDNLTIYYSEITGSRFHTDEEVSEYNQISNKIQHIAFDYIKDNYQPENNPTLFQDSDDGYILAANNFDYHPSPYLKNVYTFSNYNGFNINIDILNSKILSLTDISQQIDTSSVSDVYNWDISGIENNTVKFGFPETGEQRAARIEELELKDDEKQEIIATCNTEDINKEYFNPDYAQQLQSQY